MAFNRIDLVTVKKRLVRCSGIYKKKHGNKRQNRSFEAVPLEYREHHHGSCDLKETEHPHELSAGERNDDRETDFRCKKNDDKSSYKSRPRSPLARDDTEYAKKE